MTLNHSSIPIIYMGDFAGTGSPKLLLGYCAKQMRKGQGSRAQMFYIPVDVDILRHDR